MSQHTIQFKSTWFSKFFECLFFFIVILEILSNLLDTVLSSYFKEFQWDMLLIIFFGSFVLISVVFSVWWHRKEKEINFNSVDKHSWLQAVLYCFLAYEISVYGFAKILKTQFGVSFARNDTPVGQLNGFELTWKYFGHSYSFAFILGAIQIGGSILLLFKQTRLLGIFILMPVMVNIVLINIFYNITPGAFINSLIISFGLIYLLTLRWVAIKTLFFQGVNLSVLNPTYIRQLLKFGIIAAAFFTIYYYVVTAPSSAFTGKWKVVYFKRNNKLVNLNNWKSPSDVWNIVYIEQYGKMEISANPYVYDKDNVTKAEYTYNAKNKIFLILYTDIFYKTDTEKMAVSNYNGTDMQWNTIYHNDTLKIKFLKQ